jgi:hypothetical protein
MKYLRRRILLFKNMLQVESAIRVVAMTSLKPLYYYANHFPNSILARYRRFLTMCPESSTHSSFSASTPNPNLSLSLCNTLISQQPTTTTRYARSINSPLSNPQICLRSTAVVFIFEQPFIYLNADTNTFSSSSIITCDRAPTPTPTPTQVMDGE